MCGRYALKLDADDLKRAIERAGLPLDDIKGQDKTKPSLNVAPRSYSMIYCSPSPGTFVLEAMQWTLQPSYAKEPVKYPSFNTRGESLSPLKPAWRCAKTRRAVVFMNGYYEWQRHGKEKLPYFIHSNSDMLLAVLALWDSNPRLGDTPTYSIVTTSAAPELEFIHPRMPVVTSYEGAKRWVGGSWPDVLELVHPRSGLESYRVAQDVNRVGVDKPGLDERLGPNAGNDHGNGEKKKEMKEHPERPERPLTEWFGTAAKPTKRRDPATETRAKKHKAA